MHILVVNSGSSSVKFSVFEADGGKPRSQFEGELSGIGGDGARLVFRDAQGNDIVAEAQVRATSTAESIHAVIDVVSAEQIPAIDAVGYRVVHPGAKLKDHCRITEQVLVELEAAAEFAPLHNPVTVEVIRAAMERMPEAGHYACFDTVFHESMGEAAMTYALPVEVRERGVRRYGFHGLSCESIVVQLREAAEGGEMTFPERMVIAHLGSGCSVTAVMNGRSVDTTMGLTPTGGVVMGTRPGDLDPGVMLYLLRRESATVDSVEKMVNHSAGMVALSGMRNDMKTVRGAAAKGDPRAKLAIEVFTRSVRKTIGGLCWVMGGADAIVFTGGIGEHDDLTRGDVLGGLEEVGVELDVWLDGKGEGVRLLSEKASRVAVYVVPAEEDRMIAAHVMNMTNG